VKTFVLKTKLLVLFGFFGIFLIALTAVFNLNLSGNNWYAGFQNSFNSTRGYFAICYGCAIEIMYLDMLPLIINYILNLFKGKQNGGLNTTAGNFRRTSSGNNKDVADDNDGADDGAFSTPNSMRDSIPNPALEKKSLFFLPL